MVEMLFPRTLAGVPQLFAGNIESLYARSLVACHV
jgi:hypothetical protein